MSHTNSAISNNTYAACMFDPPSDYNITNNNNNNNSTENNNNNNKTIRTKLLKNSVVTVVSSATSTTDDYPTPADAHAPSSAWASSAMPQDVSSGVHNHHPNQHHHHNNQHNHQRASSENASTTPTTTTTAKKRSLRRAAAAAAACAKSVYKHVPHKDKPPHLVARRNARERRRVQAVNSAFARLRRCVPVENRSKRLSKVKTLHKAIEYISHLQELLDEADTQIQVNTALEYSHPDVHCKKENGDRHLTAWTATIDLPNCRQDDFDAFTSFYEGYVDYPN